MFRHSTSQKPPFARRMERRKGKGRRTKPTCVYPSFSDISIEKKTTATNQPTHTQPTSPTNIQHGGPPSAGPTNISLSSFSHSSCSFFPCLRVCSFPVGDPGCVLFSLSKRLQKKDWRTPNVYFRVSNFEKHKHFHKKDPRRILGPHFPTRTFLALLLFFCDTIVVFSIQCL